MQEHQDEADEATGWWGRLARTAVKSRADALLAVLDMVLLAAAYIGVLVLRFDGNVPQEWWEQVLLWLPFATVVGVLSLWSFGLYGQVWRHASADEARRLLDAMGVALLVLIGVELIRGQSVPWTVVFLGTGLGGFLLGAVRFRSRLFSFRRKGAGGADGLRVIIIGGKDAGAALIGEMRKSPMAGLVPVAILDPDETMHGRWIMGLRVAGGYDQLPEVAELTGAHQAVLAMTSTTSETVRVIAAYAEQAGVALKIVDGIAGRMRGEVGIRHIRNLRIDDLIGREQVETDLEAVRRMLAGRRVLVTGAGGSIGSEIVRQVAEAGPSTLVALDHDESHLHDMAATLDGPVVQLLADVRDRTAVERAFARHKPEIVFHAAAHKHVPLLEDHPSEAILTNVAGTQHLLEAAEAAGVERFVFISTDKAVAPKSVMGASKRLGEHLVLGQAPPGSTHAAVRFGNVIGSRGSVVPTFVRQIEDGGPVTVTDERMTRYFMSIPEAVQLVLQAAALAQGGDLFVLDMGEPVRIFDLAERMIRLSGMRPGVDIEVRVTGVRPGEKLVEELLNEDEPALPTVHESISRISPTLPSPEDLRAAVTRLRTLAEGQRDDDVRAALFASTGPVIELGAEATESPHVASDDAPTTQTD
ncbi:polysaccharide biosynthesis protein [Acidimicrobiia bacterium EGI L10123]|uniref:polysaccharide biosynthesis protein n=1 Tax=Salinilacustrithrix flava TaxID=2957203 RepID=UPI003D7C3107|nr:polysaccharide biosynthesis protein [Acidimicrobiia bacterium EGI L10123]